MIEHLRDIDIGPILECYHELENTIQWTEYSNKGKQVGLQYKNDEDPWSSAVGRSTGDELTSINLNPFFKNTIFEELINEFNLKKTRLMWVKPFACYTMHKDETLRIHIPLITNPDCYFLFKYGTPVHLPIGKVYLVDTRKPHTFINCSEKPRLHLVGAKEI